MTKRKGCKRAWEKAEGNDKTAFDAFDTLDFNCRAPVHVKVFASNCLFVPMLAQSSLVGRWIWRMLDKNSCGFFAIHSPARKQ
jgi:hypothetical protein